MAIIRLQGEEEKRKGIYFQLDTADEPIGAGGMGQVFKGICVNTQTHAVREVAIKFMYDDLPAHAIERGRREASIQLRNDNLIEMLVADVQYMRLCQRESKNKLFYDYSQRAQSRLNRIKEEMNRLNEHQRQRVVYAETDFHIVRST